MTPEFRRRRGRPSKFGRGVRVVRIPMSDAALIALTMIASYEHPVVPRSNRVPAVSIDYARDVLEQFATDRFKELFQVSIGEFLRSLVAQ